MSSDNSASVSADLNGNSTDRTVELLEEAGIRVQRQKERGLGAARPGVVIGTTS